MHGHLATFIFFTAFVAAVTLSDGEVRTGFRLFPRSAHEAQGIVLRAIQLLFLVSLYLSRLTYVEHEIVEAL